MKPEQLNRAIAEREGWRFIPSHDVNFWFGERAVPEQWDHPDDLDAKPEYTISLDAIVPLVRKLETSESWRFDSYLTDELCLSHCRPYKAVSATPLQLSTAYAKTVGIWRDDE